MFSNYVYPTLGSLGRLKKKDRFRRTPSLSQQQRINAMSPGRSSMSIKPRALPQHPSRGGDWGSGPMLTMAHPLSSSQAPTMREGNLVQGYRTSLHTHHQHQAQVQEQEEPSTNCYEWWRRKNRELNIGGERPISRCLIQVPRSKIVFSVSVF
jgi:hypothetical protein